MLRIFRPMLVHTYTSSMLELIFTISFFFLFSGAYLVTGSLGGNVAIWSLANGDLVFLIYGWI